MGWRAHWPNPLEAADIMPQIRGNLGVGRVSHAPDYESTRNTPFTPGPDYESTRNTPFTPDSDAKTYLPLTREEVAMLGRLRNLRPGQELRVTRCEHGATWDTLLTDVTEDPS